MQVSICSFPPDGCSNPSGVEDACRLLRGPCPALNLQLSGMKVEHHGCLSMPLSACSSQSDAETTRFAAPICYEL